MDINIHYWRTQSGAEVDFILKKGDGVVIPIEAKFRAMTSPVVSRSFRSFIEAYEPRYGIFITKDYNKKIMVHNCEVHFISFWRLEKMMSLLEAILQD